MLGSMECKYLEYLAEMLIFLSLSAMYLTSSWRTGHGKNITNMNENFVFILIRWNPAEAKYRNEFDKLILRTV